MNAQTCENLNCRKEIDELKQSIAEYAVKYNELKKTYHSALVENLKRDVILEQLCEQNKTKSFDEFKNDFTGKALLDLQLIGTSEREDSTFILSAVRNLFQEKRASLKNSTYRSLSSTEPEKIDNIRKVYYARLESIQSIPRRYTKFPKHVKTAIESINKKNK